MAIGKQEAQSLLEAIREHLLNAEQFIILFIHERGWEPLGYDSFVAAWDAEMKGVRLATEALRAHVIYAMFDLGLTDEEVVEAVSGQIGDQGVARLRTQRDHGVPPSVATTRVRAHERALPSQPEKLHITLTHGEVVYFKELADALGLDREEEAAKAVRAHFRKLERARRGNA